MTDVGRVRPQQGWSCHLGRLLQADIKSASLPRYPSTPSPSCTHTAFPPRSLANEQNPRNHAECGIPSLATHSATSSMDLYLPQRDGYVSAVQRQLMTPFRLI